MTDSTANASDNMSVTVINYDEVARSFEASLVTKLRGNTPEQEFLALWVPDSNPIQGILNMIDAAFEAGRTGIAIRVSRQTLSDAQKAELVRRAGEVGQITVVASGADVELRADRLNAFDRTVATGDGNAGAVTAVPRVGGAPALSAHEKFVEDRLSHLFARQAAGEAKVHVDLSGAPDAKALKEVSTRAAEYGRVKEQGAGLVVAIEPELAPFARVAPPFRAALRQTLAAIRHEGTVADGEDLVVLEAKKEGAVLSIAVDRTTHFVQSARHKGASDDVTRAVLEAFCAVVENVPIQEASDYSGFRLLHTLRDRSRSRPVRGIMRTVNAGQPLGLPVDLVRDLRAQYAEKTGYRSFANGFEPAPSSAWVALSREEMLDRINRTVTEFEGQRGLLPRTMPVQGLTKNTRGYFVRVFVGFAPGVDWRVKPTLMLALERRLKDQVEGKLQVYHEEMKDKSQLRRL